MKKSGFVSIIGRPNVGKSTLLNQFLGEKLAITSNKPQTTRNRIHGIYTNEKGQIVFIDTPGIHKPSHKLGEYMVKAASTTIGDVDLILLLVEPRRPGKEDLMIIDQVKKVGADTFLIINKIDTIPKVNLLECINTYKDLYSFQEIVPICAFKGDGVRELQDLIFAYLPEGPGFFPDDMITDQPERQLVAEYIREKALYVLDQEIPHGIAVVIDTFAEREDKAIVDINATIICEKESHKPIIIGKQGATIREIGSQARREIERLLGMQVNLKLWVKVKERWRDSEFLVKNFGFDKKEL